MKNILVTGGCGFIGTNFISHQLNNTNNKILNLDKLTYSSNLDSGNNLKGNKHYSFIRTDICDSNAVKKAFDEFLPDIIVNFAAETHVDRSIDSPSTFVKTNVFGTLNLLNISLNYFLKIQLSNFYILALMRSMDLLIQIVNLLLNQTLIVQILHILLLRLVQII